MIASLLASAACGRTKSTPTAKWPARVASLSPCAAPGENRPPARRPDDGGLRRRPAFCHGDPRLDCAARSRQFVPSDRLGSAGTAWFGVRLGERILSLERRPLRLGARSLCSPCGRTGTGPLASRRRFWLVLGTGPLALAKRGFCTKVLELPKARRKEPGFLYAFPG